MSDLIMDDNFAEIEIDDDETVIHMRKFWIDTPDGPLDYEDPEAYNYDPKSLFRAMTRFPRFCGLSDNLSWTLAHHSLFVDDIVQTLGKQQNIVDFNESWNILRLRALFHDAHEPFLGGDIPTPLKKLIGKATRAYDEVEENLSAALLKSVCISRAGYDTCVLPEAYIKILNWADEIALVSEAVHLELPNSDKWLANYDSPAVPIPKYSRRPYGELAERWNALTLQDYVIE